MQPRIATAELLPLLEALGLAPCCEPATTSAAAVPCPLSIDELLFGTEAAAPTSASAPCAYTAEAQALAWKAGVPFTFAAVLRG